jgi:hypothetical protein
MERCETCRFARAYPQPSGECPTRQEPPQEKWWEAIFSAPAIPYLGIDWPSAAHYAWKAAKNKADNMVRCHRFPEASMRPKAHFCGEYQPHPGGDND